MSESIENQPDSRSDEQREFVLRTPPLRVSGLRRKTIRLAIALLALVVAAALMFGLGINFRSPRTTQTHDAEPPSENSHPSPIADLPSSYADVPRSKPAANATSSSPMPEAMHHHDEMTSASDGDPRTAELARLLASIQQVGQKNKELADRIAGYHSQLAQERTKVWGSGLFFKIDDRPDQRAAEQHANPIQSAIEAELLAKQSAQAAPTSRPSSDQEHKLSFLNDVPTPRLDVDRSAVSVNPAASPAGGHLLQVGAVIPAALLTGINTDLPGDVVASVTEGVYDSPTGDYLLIPQGARLYGSYDSQIAPSQDRALLVWHRLLLPDGHSVNLDRMRGTDAAGYSGVSDQVDYHADKLATAAVLSGVIAYAGNLAGGRQTLTQTPGDVVGNAVAQQAANTGSQIVQRQLNVQPTITIRPGWPVRVLVNRDLLLPSYTN